MQGDAQDMAILNMAIATEKTLDDNKSNFDKNAGFIKIHQSLKDKITDAKTAQSLIVLPTTGVTIDKATARHTLDARVDILVGNVTSFALSTGNNTLYNAYYHSTSELQYMTGTKIVSFTTALLKEIDTNNADYLTVGLDVNDVKACTTALDVFSSFLTAPRNAITKHAALNSDAHDKVQLLKPVLKEIDAFMRPFKSKNPTFFNTYTNSRKIVDPASSPTKATVLVKDSVTGAPIPGATVSTPDKKHTAITDMNGIAHFDTITHGTTIFEAVANGYQPGSNAQGTNLLMGQNTPVTILLTKI